MTIESNRGNTPDDAELWDALARYLAGESSPDEVARVRQWLADDPRHSELLDALRGSIATITLPAQHDVDVEAALRQVSAQLDAPAVHSIKVARERARRPIWSTYLARAAAIAAVLLGAGLVWRLTQQDTTSPGPVLTARAYDASIGAVDSVRLDDGTRVLLAPGSRITIAADYGVSNHEVELTGEALFDVAATAAGRFTVRAGGAVVRDLGTTFTVRSDASREVRVIVTSGSVVLRAAAATDSGTVLRAGDRGRLGADGRVTAERGSASTDDLAWTGGRLVFNNATLAQVADELRRWYGIQLQFADSTLVTRHITASFDGEAVDSVMAVIELALGVQIDRSGDTATVRRIR